MSSIVKKKKKSLLAKIIDRLLRGSSLYKQEDMVINDSFDDVRISEDEITTIASRRTEMSISEQYQPDATVTFHNQS